MKRKELFSQYELPADDKILRIFYSMDIMRLEVQLKKITEEMYESNDPKQLEQAIELMTFIPILNRIRNYIDGEIAEKAEAVIERSDDK